MENIFVVGMTGPTGSGKSTVGGLLRKKGFKIIDADKLARRVTEKGSPTLASLCLAFGDDILLKTGELDRAALAKKAFADSESLEKLNSITHPAIITLIEQKIEELKKQGEAKIVIDAPQLFEAGADKLCSFIVSVLSDRETRLERIMSRDNISLEQANARINAQRSDDFFIQSSDLVIYNNSDEQALVPQVEELIKAIPESILAESNKKEKAKRHLMPIFAIAVVAIVLIIFGCVMLLSSNYESAIDKSITVCKTPTTKTIRSVYPEQTWELLLERYSSIDPSIDSVDDIIDTYLLTQTTQISEKMKADFGQDWTISYEIISEQRLSRDDCEKISEDLKKSSSPDIRVSRAYTINLYYTINGTKTSEGFMHFTAVKISGRWYAAENLPNAGWRIKVLEF